jgi:hypothetical protein
MGRNRQNLLLSRLFSPITACHQPQERGFDPSHAGPRKWLDESSSLHRWFRDLLSVSLIDDDAVTIKVGADLAKRSHQTVRMMKEEQTAETDNTVAKRLSELP